MDTPVLDRAGNRLQPIHVIGHCERPRLAAPQSSWSTFQEAHAAGCLGSSRVSVWRTTWFDEYAKASRAARSRASASCRTAQRIVGVCCHHHGIESLAEPGAGAHGDPLRIAKHVDHAIADRTVGRVDALTRRSTYAIDPPWIVRHGSAFPRPMRP